MDESRAEHTVQLISSASQDKFDNTTSKFTTLLGHPLHLQGEWEVGMINCSYHRNLENISTADDAKFHIKLIHLKKDGREEEVVISKYYHLPWPGQYVNPQSVIRGILDTSLIPSQIEIRSTPGMSYNKIRMVRPTLGAYIQMSFNPATQTFQMWRPEEDKTTINWIVVIRLHPKLAYLLGQVVSEVTSLHDQLNTKEEVIEHSRGPHVFLVHPNLASNETVMNRYNTAVVQYNFPLPCALQDIWNFFLYTDIVHHSRLADTDADYLYMIPVVGKEGAYVHLPIEKIIYKRVNTDLLRSIHVELKDHTGKQIRFVYGSGDFTCLLHFRKIA